MGHSDFGGHEKRRTPYRKDEDGTRASEHGQGKHSSSGRPAAGSRSGHPTTRGDGFGGYTDGKRVPHYLPKR